MDESVTGRPLDGLRWEPILLGSGGLALAAALVIVLVPGATRLVVFVLLTLWCHGPLSPLLPAAYEPILLAYGRLFPPLLVALIGSVASTAVEYLNYYVYRRLLRFDALARVLRSPSGRHVVALFSRHPFLAVWLCVWSPLPDWAARIIASYSGYSVRRYLAAFLLARLPRFWFLAALGLHLRLGVGPVLAITAVSVILTLSMRRSSGLRPPYSAIPRLP